VTGLEAILALNAAHEVETSPLDHAALVEMLGTAFHSATEAAGRDGFLIAFDQDAPYESPNFLWFKARYGRFVYVDRIIVAAHARGRGLARTFYQGLFDRARAAGHERVVCEVNLDPPNPGSVAFHAALGFEEVGQGNLGNGKTVSYQRLRL
jgi:predicted GNAT superfamily acetyltransferase